MVDEKFELISVEVEDWQAEIVRDKRGRNNKYLKVLNFFMELSYITLIY